MPYIEPVKYTKLNTYGKDGQDDVYDISVFIECCERGDFVDCDGYGHPVRNDLSDPDILIFPSEVPDCIPDNATHIVWYNK